MLQIINITDASVHSITSYKEDQSEAAVSWSKTQHFLKSRKNKELHLE